MNPGSRPARIWLLLVLLVASCRAVPPTETTTAPTVILVSFDGFSADFLDRYDTPSLDRLIASGVTAPAGMIPSFPTLTFPNHYAIATGLYPSHNGIISNTMYDGPTDSWFRISDREAVETSMWWEGEPIWVSAEKQGQTAATFFWVGSEAPIQGIRPTYWRTFDGDIPGNERVDQVLAWLELPAPDRPSFIALYFEDVDKVVHAAGTDSDQTGEAVSRVDGYLGRLMDGLADRYLLETTDIIVVSDHGMTNRTPEKSIVLEDYISLDDVEIINTSPVAMMNATHGNAAEIVAQLVHAHPNLDVYLRENVPENLHFAGHHRIPEIIAIAGEGWTIFRDRAYFEKNGSRTAGATHGYHPDLLSMRALFAASGPSIKNGLRIESFENVNLYPLMAEILKLKPADTDGDLRVLKPILK